MTQNTPDRSQANDHRNTVYRYHQQTKHRYEGYARGPEVLDWTDQPNVFRFFTGCEAIELPFIKNDSCVLKFSELFQATSNDSAVFDLMHLGALLELAYGLSAWKSMGEERWALRCNPSSGNLHPTEVYVAVGGYDAIIPAGIYHYDSYKHQLVRRCTLNDHNWCGVIVGLSSVHWREAWKYGERAYRYCQHDLGHALASLRFAAGQQSLMLNYLTEWPDAHTAMWTGIDRTQDFEGDELEAPGLSVLIENWSPTGLPDWAEFSSLLTSADWQGAAQRLGGRHFYQWPIIDEVSRACHRAEADAITTSVAIKNDALIATDSRPDIDLGCADSAVKIIKQRRSAQRFDGETGMSREHFLGVLNATLPHPKSLPFDQWPWEPAAHLLVFVHRVEGMQPGVYLFPRSTHAVAELKQAMRAELSWQTDEAWPGLYLLAAANAQKVTKKLSCYQGIAGNGAFTLGMLTEFDKTLSQGAWHYRRLFWECGVIGQILYLQAEAAGLRGTGIGCFFDDQVHELLGLSGTQFQSLYHFTVGKPVDDKRLETLPAYAHLLR